MFVRQWASAGTPDPEGFAASGMPATQSRRGILPLGLETIIVIRQSLTEIRLRLIESA
jgi:hypothetical protein